MTLDLAPRGAPRERPVCLVGALNGAGKTSVLDAILMVLYGKRAPLRGVGQRAWSDRLFAARHRGAPPDEETFIELVFDEHSEGRARNYRVRRRWHLTGTGASERLFVIVDGMQDDDETELWDQRAEELLPLGLAGLYFFDGELIRAFAAAREPTPEVRAAIATLLGLDLASQLDRDLGAVALRRQGELVRPDEIAAVEELERRLETLNEQIVGAEARHALISEQIAEARARLELSAEQAQPVTAQPVVSEAAARLADARGALVELAAGLLPLALVEELARDVLRLGRDEVEAAAEARLGQRLDARDAELYAILDACERGSSLAGSIRAWMERDREARVARRSTPALLGATATEVDALSRALGGALDAERARAADALEEARQAALAVRLARVRPDREDPAGAGGLAELVALAAELGRVEDARAKLLDERRRVEIEHRRRFKQLQEHRISEAEGRRVVAAADRVRQIMVVYQQELVRRRIDELEQLTTDRLRLLDRKEGRVGRVWLHPETFAMRLVDTTGQPIDRDRLSAGEQQILAVAFLWALADATGRDLPVVIDTPLARLDRVHRERLIVDFFPRVSHQLVLLSTNAEIDRDGRDLLARQGALSHCQTLAYDTRRGCTEVRDGYFEETS